MKTQLYHHMKILLIAAGLATLLNACTTGGNNSLGGAKPYPRNTCLVTNNDLGSMGDEQRIVYQGQEVKFCCAPCVRKFNANPAKYLAQLSQ